MADAIQLTVEVSLRLQHLTCDEKSLDLTCAEMDHRRLGAVRTATARWSDEVEGHVTVSVRRTSAFKATVPLLIFISACGGGGSLREVQGAKFALNDNESRTADNIERASPPASAPADRCAYWKHNRETGRHTSSVMAWMDAKANEACAGEATSTASGARAQESCSDRCLPVITNGEAFKACLSNCKDEKAQAQPETKPTSTPTTAETEPPPHVPSDPVQLFSLLTSSRPFQDWTIDLHALAVFVTAYAAFANNPEVTNEANQIMKAIRQAKAALLTPTDTLSMKAARDPNDTSVIRSWSRTPLPLVIALHAAVNGSGNLYQRFISEQGGRLAPATLLAMQEQVVSERPNAFGRQVHFGCPLSSNLGDLKQFREDLEEESRHAGWSTGWGK